MLKLFKMSLTPYVVRHLSAKTVKSKLKRRRDRLSMDEFERLVAYFDADARIQAYLTLSLESLGRPQELLYLRIQDVELHDDYARISLSEHGKEGPGLLQCIDSYPYLLKWLERYPLKADLRAFLFLNTGERNRCRQLKPGNINALIRAACRDLGIDKPVTCYSLKRNGVTMRRLRGDTDLEIQHAARWTSLHQLKTYDQSNQEDAFARELQKRGLPADNKGREPKTQTCGLCAATAGFSETLGPGCKRPLKREAIVAEAAAKDRQVAALRDELDTLQGQFQVRSGAARRARPRPDA